MNAIEKLNTGKSAEENGIQAEVLQAFRSGSFIFYIFGAI
jgi:hypothetical protein